MPDRMIVSGRNPDSTLYFKSADVGITIIIHIIFVKLQQFSTLFDITYPEPLYDIPIRLNII
jgi:hypothetical protein